MTLREMLELRLRANGADASVDNLGIKAQNILALLDVAEAARGRHQPHELRHRNACNVCRALDALPEDVP